jgi:hypothetical protein
MFEAAVLHYIKCRGNLIATGKRSIGFASTEHAWYTALGDGAIGDTCRRQDCSFEPTSHGMEQLQHVELLPLGRQN